MKSCPTCNRTYPDDTLAFCLVDGSILSAPYEPGKPVWSTPAAKTEVLKPSAALTPTMPAQHPPEPWTPLQTPAATKDRGRKLPLILITAVAVIIFLCVGLYMIWPSRSLGIYKGSLVTLFPNSLGSYQLGEGRSESAITVQLKARGGWLQFYRESDRAQAFFPDLVPPVEAQAMARPSGATMLALNFSSSEAASTGLQDLRKLVADASVLESGAKRKGLYTVGERVVLNLHKDTVKRGPSLADEANFVRVQSAAILAPESNVVIWTNGSVLFLLQGNGSRPSELERLFPY
jgi:hypothetical protein